MQDLKLQIPEGHEVDLENSDLSKGIVKLKVKAEKKNVVTLDPNGPFGHQGWINGKMGERGSVAFIVFTQEEDPALNNIHGHGASLYLYSDGAGQWYNENGDEIRGELFYKPNNQ